MVLVLVEAGGWIGGQIPEVSEAPLVDIVTDVFNIIGDGARTFHVTRKQGGYPSTENDVQYELWELIGHMSGSKHTGYRRK